MVKILRFFGWYPTKITFKSADKLKIITCLINCSKIDELKELEMFSNTTNVNIKIEIF